MTLRGEVVLKNTSGGSLAEAGCLGALAPNAASQLDILGHDGDALGVDGGKVGVLEQAHQVSLSRFLKRQDST